MMIISQKCSLEKNSYSNKSVALGQIDSNGDKWQDNPASICVNSVLLAVTKREKAVKTYWMLIWPPLYRGWAPSFYVIHLNVEENVREWHIHRLNNYCNEYWPLQSAWLFACFLETYKLQYSKYMYHLLNLKNVLFNAISWQYYITTHGI